MSVDLGTANEWMKDYQTKRSGWEQEFDKNHKTLSNSIAATLANQIINTLKETLQDAFKYRPSINHPLTFTFDFGVTKAKNVQNIQQWAEKSAELSPFKEWFERFGKTSQENRESSSEFSSIGASSLPVSGAKEMKVDTEYFLKLITQVGSEVTNALTSQMNGFLCQRGNTLLEGNVHWVQSPLQRTGRIEASVWVQGSIPTPQKPVKSGSTAQKALQQRPDREARQKIVISCIVVVVLFCLAYYLKEPK